MNKDESPIFSTNVSLGSTKASLSSSSISQQQPWVILLCSDLGFVSDRPCKVTAATLNEIITTVKPCINGKVEKGLPPDIAPFYIEYPISDIKDLSPSYLPVRLPYLMQLKSASSLLDDISRKRIGAIEGLKRIAAMSLPQTVMRQLGTIVPQGGGVAAATTPVKPAASSSKIDSILSMMDVDAAKPAAPAKAPQDDFVSLFTENAAGEFSPSALLNCKDTIDRLIETLYNAIAAQPFFAAATSSWNAVKTLLKIAGRNREVVFFLHGAPYDAAVQHFAEALAACASETGAPDMVVWDYPVIIDTATMQQLEHIGAIAEKYKTVILASLDRHDDLYRKILDREPLKPVIEQPAYIPLKRLQDTSQARCLALCAPDAVIERGQESIDVSLGGAWLLAIQWVSSLIENSSPFHLQNSSITALDSFAFPKLSSETVFDANQCGITLLRPNSTTTPRVLFGSGRTQYGSLLFNLLVNRTARLAAEWIICQDSSMTADSAAPALVRFLQTQLKPYHILSSDRSVAVTATGQSLRVTVDSDVTVAGFPVKFEFSFNYRE